MREQLTRLKDEIIQQYKDELDKSYLPKLEGSIAQERLERQESARNLELS